MHQFEIRLFLGHAWHIRTQHRTYCIVQSADFLYITAAVVRLQLRLTHLFQLGG